METVRWAVTGGGGVFYNAGDLVGFRALGQTWLRTRPEQARRTIAPVVQMRLGTGHFIMAQLQASINNESYTLGEGRKEERKRKKGKETKERKKIC